MIHFYLPKLPSRVVTSADILKLAHFKLQIRGQSTGAQPKLKNPLLQDDLFTSELFSAVKSAVQNQGDKSDKETDAAEG